MRTLVAVAVALVLAGVAAAQEPEVLTLNQAVTLAMDHNRPVQTAALEVRRVQERIQIERTKLLPTVTTWALGGQLLARPSVRYDPGVFGTYPGIGAIPATRTDVTTGRVLAGAVAAQASVPITQRIRTALTLQGLKLEEQLNREMERERRHSVTSEVKRTYYTLQQTESQLTSAQESIKLYREALRVTENNLKEQTVLPGDLLEVRTRLARAEWQTLQLSNGLDSGRELLNELLGRDITTPFRTDPLPEEEPIVANMAEARSRAIAARPELAQARLRLQGATLDRRSRKFEYLPNVSLAFDYFSSLHFTGALPANIGIAGVQISWEPFDWGRIRHETTEKRHVESEAELAVRETESRILRDVGAQYRKLEESRRQLAVARLSEQTAAENLRVVQNKYTLQAALLKDVLADQTLSADAAAQYRQALSQFWTARAEFERSMGDAQ